MLRRTITLLLAALFALLLIHPAAAQAPDPADALRTLALRAEAGEHAVAGATPAQLRAAYEELHEAWEAIEDGVRDADAAGYVALETKLDALKDAVAAQQPDAVASAFAAVEHEALEVAEGLSVGGPAAEAAPATMAGLAAELDQAYVALEAGDAATAEAHLMAAIKAWPTVEGEVAAKSPEAYTAIEIDLGRAAAALEAEPAQREEAEAAVGRLRAAVAPFAQRATTYTAFDAAAILLREGLEALLVIIALLAFLRRSGNSDKRGWIWAGGALGMLASVVAGFALQAIFSAASAGQNRELVEGVTGIVAAAMLFYVAYWLHSNASLGAWKRYIDERTGKALASGSLVGLALLAFLAVFREGAETVVFYLGIAPAITPRDLVIGFGAGAAILAVVAVLMLVFSVRLPLRLFFRVAGLLVYYLGFKFVGTGIHALQVAGVITTTPAPVPAVPFFGIYPTWETLIPQMLLLIAAGGALVYFMIRDQRALAAAHTA
ncbi:MAG: FTR1 family iron permease [Chloroflexales bacterium]|nr:FTR1 family iron permease [Chloroflexales bacterium]